MTYQDYILRHIQQAGRAWARIVRLIKDHQFETVHMVLDQAYRQLIGLSPEAVLTRSPNDLIARLRFDEAPAAGRDKCLAMATLLRAPAISPPPGRQRDSGGSLSQGAPAPAR